jgi:hypothetical protein
MAGYPDRCPSCKEPNIANLNYCAVCGIHFKTSAPQSQGKPASKKAVSKDQKINVKKLKKKKELIDLYKRKKISNEQFSKGMAKLGYSTDVEKALEFKKYIKAQIQAFEDLDVSGAEEGGYHYDPNESEAKLPRDENGNVIIDFSIGPTPAASHPTQTETYAEPRMISSRPPPTTTSSGGPLFGQSLFGGSSSTKQKTPRKEIPKATLKRDVPVGSRKNLHRRKKDDMEWDDEEGEEEIVEDEEMVEEEFVIDLDDEDAQGESGWWDDDEWELDWSDEDEEDWEDWEIDSDEDDEWEIWEEEHEHPPGLTVEFEDDEEEDDDVFDPRTHRKVEEEEDEEDDDEDWDEPRARRKRRH